MKRRINILRSLVFLVFFGICVLIGLISYHLIEYYDYVRDYDNDHQRLIGFRNPEEVSAMFDSLRGALVKNRRSSLTQFPADLTKETVDPRLFTSPDETKGEGIPYLSFQPVTVNYGGLYFPVKNKTQHPPENQRMPDDEEKIDRFVAAKLFDDLIDLCKKKHCNNYQTYNTVMWDKLFTNQEGKNLGIGKIYIASRDNLAVYPFGTINSFTFENRPWWKAAYGDSQEGEVYSGPMNPTDQIRESGVTKVYPDIVSEYNITDLTRTVWFKFNAYKKEYIFAVDVRLNPGSFSLWGRIWPEVILLPLLLLALPVLIYLMGRHKYVITSPPPLVYKVQRIDRQKASYRANQRSEYKLAVTQSVRKTEENIARIKSSNVLSVDAKLMEAKLERVEEVSEGTAQTELVEIKVEKTIDLSLRSGNLKTFELWKISHPNNEKYVLGLIEVLWQNNRSDNEITFDKYFWDSNTSANFDFITKELKKHLHTTENDALLVDQGSQSDAKPDIIGILKEKLTYVKDFATKSESFNNRVLLFDDNAPILKQLYSGATKIFATCSIEFLDYLKIENKLEDIMGLHLEIRYIIDGENRKFKDYYKELDEAQKQFFSRPEMKDRLKIIEYRPSQEVIYQNRDFCIVSFGNDKCVLYTDMNDAKRGWISWREVDIWYYESIEEFIKSGGVGKSDLDNYLKNYSVLS